MALGLKGRLFALVERRIGTVAALLCLASVVMLLLLPVVGTRGTYFSENSLMIGSAATPFDGAALDAIVKGAEAYAGGLEALPRDETDTDVDGTGGTMTAAAALVVRTLQNAGLETSVHSWGGSREVGCAADDAAAAASAVGTCVDAGASAGAPHAFQNVITRVRSHRGSGGTGVVVAAHYTDAWSVVLAAKLAQIYTHVTYLGVDIHLVVVVGDYKAGLRAFAESLLGDPHESPKVNVRGLRAGVVLDFRDTGFLFETIHLQTLSDDGRQPNMDLVNSAQRLCKYRQLVCDTVLPDTPAAPAWFADAAERYLRQLPNARRAAPGTLGQTIVNYFWYLLHGFWGSGAGAPHSGLREAGVHSITLTGLAKGAAAEGSRVREKLRMAGGLNPEGTPRVDSVGYMLAGLIRGMNNLNERLHQSFWVYYYTDTELFVDYETLQPLPWLAVGAVVAASLRPSEANTAGGAPASVVEPLLAGVLLVGSGAVWAVWREPGVVGWVVVALSVIYTIPFTLTSRRRTLWLLRVKFVLSLYVACFGVLSTVLHCPLAMLGAVHAGLAAVCGEPSRGGVVLPRLLRVTVLAALAALTGWFSMTLPPTHILLLRLYFTTACVPYTMVCLAVALVGVAA